MCLPRVAFFADIINWKDNHVLITIPVCMPHYPSNYQDSIINSGGSYYLPYQIHASSKAFAKAYTHAPDFFRLKPKLDPTYKFRNKLWDAYYHP